MLWTALHRHSRAIGLGELQRIAAIALTSKIARMAWAMMVKGER
jgi:hypothetical protein